MTIASLQARATEIEGAIATLNQQPHITGCWLDSATNRKGSAYTRLAWTVPGERYASGKPKKRRRTLKADEVADVTAQVERGKRLQGLEHELEQVQQEIGRMEVAIARLVG